MSILEVSKAHMFDFYYNVMKLYFNEVKLLYTDTDSLTMEVRTNDLYNELKPIIEHFDTSNYTAPRTKKMLGKFKDEIGSIPITSFVGF